MLSFGARLKKAFDLHGQLCVGIDPHESVLETWSLPDKASSLETLGKKVIDSAFERVGIIKPQVAFFERFGSAGFKVLESLAEYAQSANLLVVMDAKRGDIGSTMQGYFDAWLGKAAPFAADALTVSPFLGIQSLNDTISQAHELGRGLFVLAATSNPEGLQIQSATKNDRTIASEIWNELARINSVTNSAGSLLGNFGAVIGATVNFTFLGLDSLQKIQQPIGTPILAPGFGAQGAKLDKAADIFGASKNQVLYSVSRSVLESGPQGLANAIELAKRQLLIGLG